LEALTGRLAPRTRLARVQELWDEVVGATIAAVARPTAERAGVVTVTCEAAVWAQELELLGGELVRRLNGALGEEDAVRELRCRVG
jgi:predicted nucleic acid-binding Zn ribbon protein